MIFSSKVFWYFLKMSNLITTQSLRETLGKNDVALNTFGK